MENGLRINGVNNGRMYTTTPDFSAGGVAFFSGNGGNKPEIIEAKIFIDAVKGKGKLTVLPEQAAVVTRILEAIYKSAETGKPVFFD